MGPQGSAFLLTYFAFCCAKSVHAVSYYKLIDSNNLCYGNLIGHLIF